MALDDFPTEAELASGQALPRVPAAAEAPESEDLFDFPTIVAFAEEGAEGSGATLGHLLAEEELYGDLDRGEDLFDEPELEESIDAATRSVTHLLGEVPQAKARPAKAKRTSPETSRSADVVELDLRAQRGTGPAQAPAPVVVAGPSRAIWILVAAALLLNLGFFAFLWQTSRAFQETLVEVRAERAQTASVPAATVSPPRPSAGEGLDPAQPRLQAPVGIEPAEEVALRLAREDLAGSRPVEARRRLFALLASVDGLERTRREHVEARASFLVAETFRSQALAGSEGRP